VTAESIAATAVAHPRLLRDAPTLQRLQQRARANDPAWIALQDQCDFYLRGVVNPPGVDPYPDGGSIGEGYKGDEYAPALLNVGLAYRVAREADPERARRYGTKGAEILFHMSTPEGDPNVPPTGDGYGIRYYGLGMALAFDWLYDALSAADRVRVFTAIDRWIEDYEARASDATMQGNYVAGYYATKGMAGLATEGDPRAAAHWEDFLTRVHEGMVRPYYQENLPAGGWPEGHYYGPPATVNMLLPLVAAKTARDLDLVNTDPPYRFASGAARWYLHFTLPGLRRVDDRGTLRDQPEPAPPAVRSLSQTAIARSWLTDDGHVRKIIYDFNERGFDSLFPRLRAGRPRRITVARRQRIVGVAGAVRDPGGGVDALVAPRLSI
jgi:hypothetical protein